jgi:putative DNA primase/helicase
MTSHVNVEDEWTVRKAVDDETGEHFYRFAFPTQTGNSGEHLVPFVLARKPSQLVDELLTYGAQFPAMPEPMEFVRQLIDADTAAPAVIVHHGGYRGDGFIFPNGENIGAVPTTVIWNPAATHDVGIGLMKGSPEGWNHRVVSICELSNPLTFSVMTTLAGPALRFLPLPETAVFNFAGPSSTGKTTLAKVAASVFGDPGTLPTWNATPRGLEELASLYSSLTIILNDTESFPDDAKELRRALKAIAQTIPEGQSRTRSSSVSGRGKHLRAFTWSAFGLSTSIKTAEALARDANSSRSEGE